MALGLGSVRNRPKHHSANAPRDAQVFCPDEHPAALGVGPAGPAADAGEVRSGVGLGPALAPDLGGRGHRRQEARLLLGGAELEHGRGQQEDAVLADPQRGLGPPVLLLEHQPLEDARPRDRRTPRATTRPTSGRRPARPPRPGGPRSPRRCRATAGSPAAGRAPPARRGPRPGRPPGRRCSAGPSAGPSIGSIGCVPRSAGPAGARRGRGKSDTPPDFRQPGPIGHNGGMASAVIVDVVRTPVGKKNGRLSGGTPSTWPPRRRSAGRSSAEPRGSPSMRSATTLRWISLVPA